MRFSHSWHALNRFLLLGCCLALAGLISGCGFGPQGITSAAASTFAGPADAVVTFAATVSYETALSEIVDLGLRLENPCYEAEVNSGAHLAWYPMGQRDSFTQTHALAVTVTVLAPGDWFTRLQALAGVSAVRTPVIASCPTR